MPAPAIVVLELELAATDAAIEVAALDLVSWWRLRAVTDTPCRPHLQDQSISSVALPRTRNRPQLLCQRSLFCCTPLPAGTADAPVDVVVLDDVESVVALDVVEVVAEDGEVGVCCCKSS